MQNVLLISEDDLAAKIATIVNATYEKAAVDALARQNETYLSPKAVAAMLDVNLSTLWRWGRRAYLTPIKIGSKSRYRKSDIENLLNKEVKNDR